MAQKGNTNGFKRGYDANRYVKTNNGLVAFHNQLGELLRAQSIDAVSFLINTMNDDKAALKLRMVAAKEILDRGIGRPVDRVVVASLDASTGADPAKVTTAELEAMVSKLALEGEYTVNTSE